MSSGKALRVAEQAVWLSTAFFYIPPNLVECMFLA